MGSNAPEPNITFPLTPMQEGMLFHCLAAPQSGVDVEQVIGTIGEPLDLLAFNRAWQRLVDRHEALRMQFVFDERGTARQFPRDRVVFAVDHTDWSDLLPQERELRLQDYLKEDRRRGFDPRTDLPSRVAVFRFGQSAYCFVWTWWHGILDGRARLILLRELFLFYEAELHGNDCDLPLSRPYTEYTKWLAGRESTAALPYWKALLGDFSEPTAVSGTRPAVTDPSADRFNKHEVRLSEADTTRLRAFVGEHGVTMNTLIQAAWALVLGAFSGQDDVVFGNTRACRRSAFDGDGSGDGVVGALINTVPVRIRIGPEMRVVEWLRQLREQHLAVRPFELTPLVQIQACSGVRSDRRLFDSLVVYENQLLDSALRTGSGDWATRRFEIRGCPGFPLLVYGYGEPSLLLGIANDRQRVDDATAARMLAHLVQAILSLAEHPQALVTAIPLLPAAERKMLLEDWNRTEAPFEVDGTIDSCFARQAARTPNAPALTFNGQCWSFRELDEAAEGIAKRLRAAGAKPEVVVGVCIGRGRELVASLLGILKSGAAYLPLDPTYPNERLATMIQDSQPLLVLATEFTTEILAGTGARIMLVDGDVEDPLELSAPSDWQPASSRNLAYLIYTSGSTGTPKGVMVEHRNVMNFFAGLDRVFGQEPGVCLAVVSVSFDPSVHDILWSLTRGYHVVLWPGVEDGQGDSIPDLILAHGVTSMAAVPSFYRMVMMMPNGIEALRSLRWLTVGGEPLPREMIHALGPEFSGRIVNMYGPTETTVAATAWPVDPEAEVISIGRPIMNTTLFVLDPHLRPVPLGVAGEVFIGGAGVTRGYLNRPELTAEKFIKNPFGQGGGWLYRTGDLARYLPDGNLEYLGRLDDQVKIRGHRIELGEIEERLSKHPDVRAGVIDVQVDAKGQKSLVAYVVSRTKSLPTTKQFREWLGRQLPAYMVPAAFVKLEVLPRTANGKLDRRALPPPDETNSSTASVERAATPLENSMLKVWRETLNHDRVGLDDDFFDLGGNSLLAVQMVATIRKRFGVELPLQVLFESPTAATLARRLLESMATANSHRGSKCGIGADSGETQRSATENRLLQIWERMLNVRPIGIQDSFFSLGGDLKLLDQMVSEVRGEFGIFAEGIPVSQFMEEPTIEALARIIDGSIEPTTSLVVPLQPRGNKAPLFLIHAGGGYVFFYRALALRLGMDRPVYGVRAETESDGLGRSFHKSGSIEELAARYISQIKAVQPNGPYRLGGACIGGVIAFEMARQLRAQGEGMAGPLILFDAFVMNNPHVRKEEALPILRQIGILPPESHHEGLWRRIAKQMSRARQLGLLRAIWFISTKVVRNAYSEAGVVVRMVIGQVRNIVSKLAGKIDATTNVSPTNNDSVEAIQRRFMADFLKTSARVQSSYVPGVYDGSVVLLKAAASPDPERLWVGLAKGGMVVHELPGAHLDMMEEPTVVTTAARVSEILLDEQTDDVDFDRKAVAAAVEETAGTAVSGWE